MDPYALIASYPNAGQAFAESFQQGQHQGQQNMARAAMAALVKDPNNPNALAALAKVDPETAMNFRKQQMEYHKAQLAEHQDSILKGSEILRQFQPKDQASYTAALAAAQQAGIDISQVPQEYNQQYVEGVVRIADALKPRTDTTDGDIREYQQAGAGGLIPKGTTYQQFLQMKNPGMMSPVTIPANATVTMPQEATATGPNGEKIRFNSQTGQWEPIQGGQTAPAPSGGFPQ